MVFDSGVGGLNVFLRLTKAFPFARFFYLSDGKRVPYGQRSEEELFSLALAAMGRYEAGFDAFVLGCNTLSVISLKKLEDYFKRPFFGVRPPKPRDGVKSLLLCTRATAASEYVRFLRKNYSEVFCPEGWVEEVEREPFSRKDELVFKELEGVRGKGFEQVTLGCTHYIFLKDEVTAFFKGVRIEDGMGCTEGDLKAFFEKTVGQTATDFSVNDVTEKNFLGECGKVNFEVFMGLKVTKSHKRSTN